MDVDRGRSSQSHRAVDLRPLRDSRSILDVGAGDLRIKSKLERAGFRGHYATLDQSPEFGPDFASFAEVPSGAFDAVMLLEVIEHVPLHEFDRLMDEVLRCLAPGGRLVVSTPNTAYAASLWDADMTHVHGYRLIDLAAYLHLRGIRSTLYRVAWRWPSPPLRERAPRLAEKVITRWILQLDYARGVLLLGERSD